MTKVNEEPIETVEEFAYLISAITAIGNMDSETQESVCKRLLRSPVLASSGQEKIDHRT